jgi:zinc protease
VTQQTAEYRIPYVKEPAKLIRFDNGHTFVFVPKKGDVFNISTWVNTGSIHEDDINNGVSHFLEHLMFKGTERFQPGEFDRSMESMGAVINAATWKDFTFYYITGPKGENDEKFLTALDMHADMMICSTLPEAEIGLPYNETDTAYEGDKRERGVVIEEIGMREDQPWTKVYNAINQLMYPEGHPYRRDVIGTRNIIASIPRDSISAYYQAWYSASNMTTIVVGDFEFDTLTRAIQKHFDFSHRKGVAAGAPVLTSDVDLLSYAKTATERECVIEEQYQTSFFIMGFHGPKAADLKETIALDIASYVLGEGRSSRLIQALVEKPAHPIFNTIGCGQSTLKLGNVFYIQGNFAASSHEEPLKQVQEEVRKYLTSEPITEDEFQRAVKKLKVDFAETSETTSGIGETIGESITVSGSMNAYTDYMSHLEHMDLETVRAAAQTYIQLSSAFTTVMVPTHA